MIAYRFFMSIDGGSETSVNPLYKDLSKEYAKETNQMFFRAKLSGKLIFVSKDFETIVNAYFGSTFDIRIQYYNGTSWVDYWQGVFYKTDCEFDLDSKTCTVTPTVKDQYTKILAGLESTFDLIQLAPEMRQINYWKRPVFQFYLAGANTIGCFQMGDYWEQDATPVSDLTTLRNTYKFGALRYYAAIQIIGSNISDINGMYVGYIPGLDSGGMFEYDGVDLDGINPDGTYKEYYLHFTWQEATGSGMPIGSISLMDGDGNILYHGDEYYWYPETLTAYGTGITGSVTIDVWKEYSVCGRVVNDVGPAVNPQNYELPSDDITTTGYKYGEPMGVSGGGQTGWEGFVNLTFKYQADPTQYGQMFIDDAPVGYYQAPRIGLAEPKDFSPIARNSWDEISVWLNNTKWELINLNNNFRCKAVVLKDAYSFASAIQKVVQAIDPSLDFQLTDDYSYLMTTLLEQTLYITPKSNILKPEYDRPAYQAPVTLKVLMDAMRDMFRAYWFIEDGKFKIEQVRYFMNGRRYSGNPGVGRDLTTEIVTRNGKTWAYVQNKIKYDKPALPERYEFGWMDDATETFNGKPLVMLSPFVTQGQKEEINVTQISTDINLMLIEPSAFSEDGFAMLSCNASGQVINWRISQGYYIQNGMLSFSYLEKQYYKYDLPCWYYKIGDDGGSEYASGIKKSRHQEVTFPAIDDPDLYELIKTDMGEGQIEKISINLTSRKAKATLGYAYGSTI